MKRTPTIADISWFLDQFRSEKLELDPPYQRRSVWTNSDRKFLLDTIFRNYPFPPVFLHQEKDERGSATFNVVDGKQRLQTILMFANDEISIGKDFGDTNLNGKKFSELDQSYKRKFWDYIVVVDYIDITSETEVNAIFDRVNRNARNLVPQELRHARYDGWFIKEAENEADDPFWEDIKVSTKANVRRMSDVQVISELLLIVIDEKIVGFDQDYLDKRYSELETLEIGEVDEDDYQAKKVKVRRQIASMITMDENVVGFAKVRYNLYSLWGVLCLNDITDNAADLTQKYIGFMQKVTEIKESSDPDDFIASKGDSYTQPSIYFQNSKGASTDIKQRNARYEVLKSALTS